jgi:hypothetical protein
MFFSNIDELDSTLELIVGTIVCGPIVWVMVISGGAISLAGDISTKLKKRKKK